MKRASHAGWSGVRVSVSMTTPQKLALVRGSQEERVAKERSTICVFQ